MNRLLILAVGLLLASPLWAATYSFESEPLAADSPPWSAGMRFSGSFTVPGILAPDTSFVLSEVAAVTPLPPGTVELEATSWELSDGLSTYTAANAWLPLTAPLRVETGADGQIISLIFVAVKPLPPHTVGQSIDFITINGGGATINYSSIIDGECVEVTDDLCANGVFVDGPLLSVQGEFPLFTVTNPPVAVPTLSQWALLVMVLSLMLLGGMVISRRVSS